MVTYVSSQTEKLPPVKKDVANRRIEKRSEISKERAVAMRNEAFFTRDQQIFA